MSTRINVAAPPRQPADVVAVLHVTAAAYQAVTERLDGYVRVQKMRPAAVPQYRLDPRPNGGCLLPLSPREQQVLAGAAEGKENSEIAGDLYLSVETVRTHVKNLLRKLDARDRAHAVHIGHMQGLLPGKDGDA